MSDSDRDLKVAEKLGEHSKAIQALEGRVSDLVVSSQETSRAVLRVEAKLDSAPTFPILPDCPALHAALREDTAKDTMSAVAKSGGWDKRTVIALIGLLITILCQFGAVVWYFGSTFAEIKAQIPERPASAYYQVEDQGTDG